MVRSSDPRRVHRLVWAGLICLAVVLGLFYSFIQPLGMLPDEAAHMKYVKFLASHGHFPKWEFMGGGEAGYESQHPPLYYALGAVVYKAAGMLPENWRWQVVRWYSLLIGIILMFVVKGFFDEYFRGRMPDAALAAAAVFATPLLLEYMSYVNPDIMSVLWCSVILWMCLRISRGEAKVRDRVVLAVALGLGLLTKLTLLGTVPLIVLAYALEPGSGLEARERRRQTLMVTVLGSLLICAWWYLRCNALYHTPFVHTHSRMPSGVFLCTTLGDSAWWHFALQTVSNTYLTTWVERSQVPPIADIFAFALIGVFLIVALAGAIARRLRKSTDGVASERGPLLCMVFLASLIVFHQSQVWFVDYEFNAGGRYLLNGIVGVQALVVGSLLRIRFGRYWTISWIVLLVALNALSIWYRLSVSNFSDVPGWHLLKLTIPYK